MQIIFFIALRMICNNRIISKILSQKLFFPNQKFFLQFFYSYQISDSPDMQFMQIKTPRIHFKKPKKTTANVVAIWTNCFFILILTIVLIFLFFVGFVLIILNKIFIIF